ncbi:MAG: HpcH/HpaI aldolase/citrate lyase family protein [Candidatus Marinimicrobia bacterium]|nr:HpcH/HpaI aldolase/citrate lyase family protein [Candidatus Neomarinimicrobiota bacterium]
MAPSYTTGPKGEKPRSDVRVTYTPQDLPLTINSCSKVAALFGKAIDKLARSVCADLGINTGHLEIEDFGALPFVLLARIEAAIKAAYPELEAECVPPLKAFCTYSSSRDKFRRSRLYLPGNQPKLMLNAGIHQPDGLILDLEDSVGPHEKEATRYLVRNALCSLDFFGAERMVRINQGEMGLTDLEFIVPHNVHLILVPKVESADQIIIIDKKIVEISKICGRTEPVYLMPILESGRGILKALEIAEASPNNVALAIGLEDYTADLGVPRTDEGKESFFARGMLVNAARAAGLQAIDTVYSDVGNLDGLRESVLEAKALGFDGKGCIHPRQIKPLHAAFAPTAAEIEKAKKIELAFDKAQEQGLGVVALGNKMIDPPVVKRAQQTLALAIASNLLAENWKEEGQ